jgi:hypothetical protein
VLHAEPFAGTSESGHYLVSDQQNFVTIANIPNHWPVFFRRCDYAPSSHDRFAYESGYAPRATFLPDDILDMAGTLDIAIGVVRTEWTTVAVWRKTVNNARNGRFVSPVSVITSAGHGSVCGSVVGTVAGDDFALACYDAGHFHSALDGFSATGGKKAFIQIAGSDISQQFSGLSAYLSGELRVDARQPVELVLYCLYNWPAGMAEVAEDELGGEIQVFLPIGVIEAVAFPMVHQQRIQALLDGPWRQYVLSFVISYSFQAQFLFLHDPFLR